MKNTVTVLNSITYKSSRNFQENVSKEIPEGIEEVYLSSCGMESLGRGQYRYFLDIEIDGEKRRLTERTTDASSYDDFKDLEYGQVKTDNWYKKTALRLIYDHRDILHQLVEIKQLE